jgi:hypothetical protein
MSYEDDLIARSSDTPPIPPAEGELPAREAALMDVFQMRQEQKQAAQRAAVMRNDQWLDGLKKNL